MNKEKQEYFPKPESTTPYWLSEETAFSRHRSSRDLPAEVDTLIIGSGYAGTCVAYSLLQQNPAASVAMYEARNICSGATGRNGGHIRPYLHRNYDVYLEKYGEERASEIVNTEWDQLWALKKIVDENNIDCEFILTRAFDVFPYKNNPRLSQDLKGYDAMMKSPYVHEEIKRDIQVFYGQAAQIASQFPGTEATVSYTVAQCWPWKLFTALLKICVDKGLNLQANTVVTDVEQRPDGMWVVKSAERGETVCKNVVFATNGYTKAIVPELSDAILPHKGHACRIVPTDKTNVPYLTNTYGILSSYRHGDYLINRHDGSIIVGGQDESMCDLTKSGYESVKEQLDNTDDSFVNEKLKLAYNENYMASKFSSWKNTPTEVSHYWSGIMGYTNDTMPFVGEMDSIGKKGAYVVAGFHGHGMPRILFASQAVAKCIATGKDIRDIPYTCPKVFFFTKERAENKKNPYIDYMFGYSENRPTLTNSVFKASGDI